MEQTRTYHTPLRSSNRTFMELKCRRRSRCKGRLRGSNRTFMELKLPATEPATIHQEVLIAPLWN